MGQRVFQEPLGVQGLSWLASQLLTPPQPLPLPLWGILHRLLRHAPGLAGPQSGRASPGEGNATPMLQTPFHSQANPVLGGWLQGFDFAKGVTVPSSAG